ncbi:protein HEG homolog 1 [Gastrophryne carolinensis]
MPDPVTAPRDSGNSTQDPVTAPRDSRNSMQGSVTAPWDSGNSTRDPLTAPWDSGNSTQDPVTAPRDSGNSTWPVFQDFGNSAKTSGTSESSAPITYPLQTPSYVMSTRPSPTTESGAPFTSFTVTAPNATHDLAATAISISQSVDPFSSYPSTFLSGDFTPATLSIQPPSSPAGDVIRTPSDQSPSELALSSALPTRVSYISPTEAPPPRFTEAPSISPPTTLPPSSSTASSGTASSSVAMETSISYRTSAPATPSWPPSSGTASSSVAMETSISYRTSAPGWTDGPFGGRNSSVISAEGMSTAPVTSTRSIPETQTAVTYGGTPSVPTTPPLTEGTNTASATTSSYHLIPSRGRSTPESPPGIPTRSQSPAASTAKPENPATIRTTTTVTTKPGKRKPLPPSPPGVITVGYPASTASTAPPPPAADLCSPNPCLNGGVCMPRSRHKGYRCECPPAWQGRHCDADVNECHSSPCPAQAACTNLPGSFTCRCPLGFIMETGAGCIQVRTFLGHIEVPRSFLNGSRGVSSKLQLIQDQILHILNASFSPISGYYQSSVINSSFSSRIVLSVQNIFLLSSNVTIQDLRTNIQSHVGACRTALDPSAACRLFLHPHFSYTAVSLCSVQSLGCDNETAECGDPGGLASCQCKVGYFKYSKTDHSCRACDDGYRLQEGTCVRCPFGMGGFNCSNPYQLITVIIAAAGGGLLLILGVALTFTCCRKSKHDISKLIFKSGDFQMSPYAEYPKTQRAGEWGRETIEMQENGSTKNLLQMTDVYYNPGLRNSEMERNGLYPYSGLPGSRHSCTYPGQYNPTFINEENRRRDYF